MPCAADTEICILDEGNCAYRYMAGTCQAEGWWSSEYSCPIVGWRLTTPTPQKDEPATLRTEFDEARKLLQSATGGISYLADCAPTLSEDSRKEWKAWDQQVKNFLKRTEPK